MPTANKQKLLNLFAYIGNDEIRKQEVLAKALDKWLGGQSSDPLSKETYFGSEIKWEVIAESFETVSMFSTKKAIILKNFDRVPLATQNQLAELFHHPNENTAVFLLTEKWERYSKLKKVFETSGNVLECKHPYSNQLPGWLQNRAKIKYQKQLSLKNAAFLLECIGEDLAELDLELNKLHLYLRPDEEITAEHIEKIILPHRSINIFEMQKSMGLRKKEQFLRALSSMLDQDEPPFLIAIRLYKHFLKLLKIRMLLEKGMNTEDIASSLHIRAFFFKRDLYRQQAMCRSPFLFKKSLARLANLECEFKRGKYTQRFEIEMAFAGLV
ncbi:DNA polymerase III subunit delta [Fibrobacterota bacterium]